MKELECPHCSKGIEDDIVVNSAASIAMMRAVAEGEKAMPKDVYELGRAASKTAKESGLNRNVVRIVDSFIQFKTNSEGVIDAYFNDLANNVNDAKSADLLIHLAQNLMSAKLVVSQHLLEKFDKEKLALLEMIFNRTRTLK